ncbi:hypothetical protein N658DRAFT_313626 [Parathielavia hyrcaniae]|uniref:Uncharacterized protein n=1 Tax=Parathielavia hyrcaniae TaxID=113614 RepID=A0AAN6PW08_9PEZI|nr:hypothetical protein N658DRAFT_313626 [Parathielavia hyrcaniae]
MDSEEKRAFAVNYRFPHMDSIEVEVAGELRRGTYQQHLPRTDLLRRCVTSVSMSPRAQPRLHHRTGCCAKRCLENAVQTYPKSSATLP